MHWPQDMTLLGISLLILFMLFLLHFQERHSNGHISLSKSISRRKRNWIDSEIKLKTELKIWKFWKTAIYYTYVWRKEMNFPEETT